MKTIWLVAVAGLFFIFGIFVGYVYGYQAGIKDVAEYATQIVDKVKVDSMNVEVNGQKIGEILDRLQGMVDKMNGRINNITGYNASS